MKPPKRLKLNECSPKRDIGYISGGAKPNKANELRSAKELHGLLRDYTFHLIGLGNTFRDIASTYGKFHGSYWRTYRGVVGENLKGLAEQLNAIDPYDVDSILIIERAIESLSKPLKRGKSNE